MDSEKRKELSQQPPTPRQALYRTMHATHVGYRNFNHGLYRLTQWSHVLTPPPASIVEIGCGNGKLCRLLGFWGYDITGLDLVRGQYDRAAYNFVEHDVCTGHLPFEDRTFDYCVSFDVLEHIPEKWINEVIWDMFRVARTVIIGISCRGKGQAGLHPTVHPPEWWSEKLNRMCHGSDNRHLVTINHGTDDERLLFYATQEGVVVK